MLYRKLIRDLKANASQFISIFLLVFLGITIYSGLNAIGYGMKISVNDFYKETNLSDSFVYGSGFTNEMVQTLKTSNGIENAEYRLQLNASFGENSTLQINCIDSNNISKMKIIEGEPYSPEKEGIWLDHEFAKENGFSLGDQITFGYEGQKFTQTIRGIVMHPEYVYAVKDESEAIPDHKTFGFGFLSSKSMHFQTEVPYNQLLLKTTLPKADLEKVIENVFHSNQFVLFMKETQPSVNMFSNEIKQMQSVQTIFPVIFLLVAILTILTTMTRITVNQRLQIGILKALGFSNRKILFHYMTYGLFISSFGSILGMICGTLFLPELVFRFQKSMYTLPEWKKAVEPYIFIIILFCIICCSFCGVLACKKQLSSVAADVLRPKTVTIGDHNIFEKTSWWKKLKFDTQWNIRDCLRNKLRGFITIFGIAGCMALILCGFGMRNTMDHLIQTSYYDLNTYETKVTLSKNTDAQNLNTFMNDSAFQFVMESSAEYKINGNTENTSFSVIGQGDFMKYLDSNNHITTLPENGIAVTSKIANKNGLKEGDTIELRMMGTDQFIECKIAKIINNPIGQGFFLSKKALESYHLSFSPTSFVTNEPADTFSKNTKNSMASYGAVQTKDDMIRTINKILEMLNSTVAIMITAAILLGIVVLYNLGVLSFFEKTRELATLKVLGFQFHRLQKLLQMQNIWLTIIGILFGIPCGYFILSFMLQYMGDNFDMQAKISFSSYLFSITGTMLLSILVSFLLSRKLKTIDMVSALKSIE